MSKDNVIITFDLHEVIFTFDYKKIFHILWHFHNKWALFSTLFHMSFIFTLIKMLWKDATDEEFYHLFEKRRATLLPFIIDITNAQKIISGMNELIQELHKKGYTLHILSNIGPRRFKQLSNDFPRILGYFDQVQIVKSKSSPAIKKPDPKFFQRYITENVKPTQQVIFIDDNKKNIRVAQFLGINVIHFKSAKDLRNKLNNLGIL